MAAPATPNGMFYSHETEARVLYGCSFSLKRSGSDMPVNTGLPVPQLDVHRLVSAGFFREEKRRREEEKKLWECRIPFLKLVHFGIFFFFFWQRKVHIVSMSSDLASSF